MTETVIPLANGETLNMGSFVITEKAGDIYHFYGLSSDVAKLPKVNAIGTGSTAFCIDTAVSLMYEKTSRTWYEL